MNNRKTWYLLLILTLCIGVLLSGCGMTREQLDSEIFPNAEIETNRKNGPTKITYTNVDGEVDNYITISYDESGKRVEDGFFNADGTGTGCIRYTYSSDGNLLSSEAYDSSNRLCGRIDYGSNGKKAKCTLFQDTGEVNYYETFEYWDNGQIRIDQIRGVNDEVVYYAEYDEKGNEIDKIYYDTYTSAGAVFATGTRYRHQIKSEYDGQGNVVLEKYYENGNSEPDHLIVYQYDESGNLIEEGYSNATRSIYKRYKTYEYTGNSKGDLSKAVTYDEDGSFWEATTYEYDERGNKTRESTYDGESSFSTVYEYDSDNRLLKMTVYEDDELEEWTDYEYEKDHLVKETNHDEDGETNSMVKYSFLKNGDVEVARYDDEEDTDPYLSVYDKNGNEIRWYDDSEESEITKNSFYYSSEQALRISSFSSGKRMEDTVYYIDFKGNEICIVLYDYNAGKISIFDGYYREYGVSPNIDQTIAIG